MEKRAEWVQLLKYKNKQKGKHLLVLITQLILPSPQKATLVTESF